MITSNFSGNLGNALTQYILTRCVAEKNNYSFGFNPKFNYDYYQGYNQLDFLNLDYGTTHNSDYHDMPPGVDNLWIESFNTFQYDNGDIVDFHPYQPSVWNISDNTKLVIRCCQDGRYYDDYKEKIKLWTSIKENKIETYKEILNKNNIHIDENLCVINVRAGWEYLSLKNVFLDFSYWEKGIKYMLSINPKMNFICVTDNPEYCRKIFDFPCIHFGIGCDYYLIKEAFYLILSNSSFAIFPAWLNDNAKFIIAPKYWARWNVSSGYWANSDVFTFGFSFMDRKGEIYKYDI